jgi:AcrR family transcriptional regulator
VAIRQRLRTAALCLFEATGFEATTTDQIASAAGISRRTFFRYLPSKEDAVFADNRIYLLDLRAGLECGSGEPIRVAGHALSRVLDGLLADADFVQRRDAVIRASAALADREVVWWGEFQRHLGSYLSSKGSGARDEMFAQFVAPAILAAFRQSLAQWLRSAHPQDQKGVFGELLDDIEDSMTVTGPRHIAAVAPTSNTRRIDRRR